jgi:hypothetical protein
MHQSSVRRGILEMDICRGLRRSNRRYIVVHHEWLFRARSFRAVVVGMVKDRSLLWTVLLKKLFAE